MFPVNSPVLELAKLALSLLLLSSNIRSWSLQLRVCVFVCIGACVLTQLMSEVPYVFIH